MRLMLATILGRSSNRRCSIKSAIFEKFSLASLRVCAARSLAAWATTGSSASISSMAFFRPAMSSIIAKPLRRQSHQWHSSFASSLGAANRCARSCPTIAGLAGTGTEAVSRGGGNALHWELRGQAALIVTGQSYQGTANNSSRAAWGQLCMQNRRQRSEHLQPPSGLRLGRARQERWQATKKPHQNATPETNRTSDPQNHGK